MSSQKKYNFLILNVIVLLFLVSGASIGRAYGGVYKNPLCTIFLRGEEKAPEWYKTLLQQLKWLSRTYSYKYDASFPFYNILVHLEEDQILRGGVFAEVGREEIDFYWILERGQGGEKVFKSIASWGKVYQFKNYYVFSTVRDANKALLDEVVEKVFEVEEPTKRGLYLSIPFQPLWNRWKSTLMSGRILYLMASSKGLSSDWMRVKNMLMELPFWLGDKVKAFSILLSCDKVQKQVKVKCHFLNNGFLNDIFPPSVLDLSKGRQESKGALKFFFSPRGWKKYLLEFLQHCRKRCLIQEDKEKEFLKVLERLFPSHSELKDIVGAFTISQDSKVPIVFLSGMDKKLSLSQFKSTIKNLFNTSPFSYEIKKYGEKEEGLLIKLALKKDRSEWPMFLSPFLIFLEQSQDEYKLYFEEDKGNLYGWSTQKGVLKKVLDLESAAKERYDLLDFQYSVNLLKELNKQFQIKQGKIYKDNLNPLDSFHGLNFSLRKCNDGLEVDFLLTDRMDALK